MEKDGYQFKASFAQQRLWVIDQVRPDTHQYNIPKAFRISGLLDFGALEKAINGIVERHEILRTYFAYTSGELSQVCLSEYSLKVDCVDRNVSDEPIDEAIQTFLRREYEHVFDLSQLPLFRVKVLKISSDDYVLSLNFHHIISDGWSASIFANELAKFYCHHAYNEPLELAKLEIQYGDYAEWQHETYAETGYEDELKYWINSLDGVSPLQIFTDKRRAKLQSFAGNVIYFDIPSDLSAKLAKLADSNQSSLFAVFMAVYQLLLSNYSRQNNICVGFPVAGREDSAIENLIGFFINTLVLRSEINFDSTIIEFIRQVRNDLLDAQANQNVPFEKLVDALVPDRDLSHTPLFQAMFSYQVDDKKTLNFGDLSLTSIEPVINTSKFDITLSVTENQGEIHGAIEYCTDLFHKETMVRMVSHYLNLLQSLIENPQRLLSSCLLLTSEESSRLLDQSKTGVKAFPVNQTALQIFEQRAIDYAEQIALVFEETSFSYRQLNAYANQLGHCLYTQWQEQDFSPIVGICLAPSLDLVISILAIMKSGAAYVMLDPAYPKKRLHYFVENSDIRLVITTGESAEIFTDLGIETLIIDDSADEISQYSGDNLSLTASPDDLAYIIYTSGSTGNPKGVMVPQRNIVRLFSATESCFSFNEQDVWTLFHSAAFDFSVWEIWGALLHGGKLIVVPYSVSRSADLFYQLVIREQVTVLNQTPSAFSQFLQEDRKLRQNLQLRYVIFGGEALDLKSLEPWYERHSYNEPLLVNMYGITETTVHVTYQPITQQLMQEETGCVIGVPIADLCVYLLDQHMNLLPEGVVGEMYVGGAGVSAGYLNLESLTRERFIDNPFDNPLCPRLYRTGDLAKYYSDGVLEYLGRADHQVKIRGFRIELGEVEAAIRQHPQVVEVVVQVKKESAYDYLLAYLVVKEGSVLSIEDIRAYIKQSLPDYMLPSVFMMLDVFPLTRNGKLDLAALPEPSGLRPKLKTEYQAPTNEKEEILCVIWEKVLDLDHVGILDNFFALGGDSLRAVQVIDHAKRQNINLNLMALFQYQTIKLLIQQDQSVMSDEFGYRKTNIFSMLSVEDRARIPDHIIDAYPLSKMQEAMFYHMELAPDSNIYHCTGTSHIKTKLPFDGTAFYRAVQDTVAKHDVFKTSFDLAGYSEPLQLVHAEATLPTVIEDLSHLSKEEQDQIIHDLLETEKRTPFDLSKPTLLRFFIHLRTPYSFQFTMTECHPIFDGWSYHSMIVEVFNRYASTLAKKVYNDQSPVNFHYRDFVALERKIVASVEQERFWLDKLDDCTILKLPRLKPQQKNNYLPSIKLKRVIIKDNNYAGLQHFMRQEEVPMKSIMLTAHLKVMSIISGEIDLLTGIPANGRPEEVAGDRLYGLFLNTLPFRFKLDRGSWSKIAKQVFNIEMESLPYRRYPFAAIQQNFRSQALIDEVLFNYLDFHIYNELDSSLGLEIQSPFDKDEVNEGTNFTLSVHFQHLTLTSNLKRNQIAIDIDYDENKLSEEQAEKISQYYNAVLTAMSRDPQAQHSDMSFLTAADYLKLTQEWSYNDAPDSDKHSLQQLFEDQASQIPSAVALQLGEQKITYSQLNQQANQLAHLLVAQGLELGGFVAVLLPRSIEFVVSILAIVKAGGVYVPLDPEDPLSRIELILKDTGTQRLISLSQYSTIIDQLSVPQITLLDSVAAKLELEGQSSNNLQTGSDHNSLLYVMYTSGSTGTAKGVEVLQHGVIRLVKDVDYITLDKSVRILQIAAVTFDASTFEVWGALLTGATLVIYPVAIPAIDTLRETIADHQVTTAFFTTALFNTIIDGDPLALKGMKEIIVGGEVSSLPHMARCQEILPDLLINNAYGPTETTTFALIHRVDRPVSEYLGSIPIGKPIAKTHVYVLDHYRQPAPIGTPGELYIGGDGVAKGYLNNHSLTTQRFIDDPIGKNGKLYRTGDLVRFLPDGNIEYLGRLDSQVKIRGYRIEPGEIETVMLSHSALEKALVTVIGEGDNKKIVLYWVAKPAATIDSNELKLHLEKRLPKYMLPAFYMQLEEFPLRRNGKVDLQALPAPDPSKKDRDLTPPGSKVGQDILSVWQEILDVEEIGIYDNFFDLGGHSLLLSRGHLRLKELGYQQLSIVDLLHHTTIHALTGFITQEEELNTAIDLEDENKIQSGRSRLKNLKKKRGESLENTTVN